MPDTGELKQEYRVVGNRPRLGDLLEVIASDCDRGLAETYAEIYGRDDAFESVRIQRRTRSPWEDVSDV